MKTGVVGTWEPPRICLLGAAAPPKLQMAQSRGQQRSQLMFKPQSPRVTAGSPKTQTGQLRRADINHDTH